MIEIDELSSLSRLIVIFDMDRTILSLASDSRSLHALRVEICDFLNSRELTPPDTSIFAMYNFSSQFEVGISNVISGIIDKYEKEWAKKSRIILSKKAIIKTMEMVPYRLGNGVITSNGRKCVEMAQKLSLFPENIFDIVITRDDVRFVKPNPESLYKLVDALGEIPDNIWYIGDSMNDLEALKRYCEKEQIEGYFTSVSPHSNFENVSQRVTFTESLPF